MNETRDDFSESMDYRARDFLNDTPLQSTHQSPQEREELARDLQRENTITARHLLYAFVVFFWFLVLCLPKIYLTNVIYTTSKEVLNLQTSKEILFEENKKLRRELEDIDFRFRVLDNLEQ